MPTYDYQCRDCGERFTLRESMEDHGSHSAPCPRCKSRNTEQRMSGFYAKTARKS